MAILSRPRFTSSPRIRLYTNGASLNTESPLTNGLVMWLLSQSNNFPAYQWLDLADSRMGTFNAMSANSATSGPGSTARTGGRGEVRFNGTGYVTTPSLPLVNSGLTVSAWINTSTFSGVFRRVIEQSFTGSFALVCSGGSGTRDLSLFINGNTRVTTSGDVINLNTCYSVLRKVI